MSSVYEPLDYMEAKRNLNRQATKVLHEIVMAYQTGQLDDPKATSTFCALLACICEGKVQGLLDDTTLEVKWSLTRKYSEEMEALKTAMLQVGVDAGKVVKGPWQ